MLVRRRLALSSLRFLLVVLVLAAEQVVGLFVLAQVVAVFEVGLVAPLVVAVQRLVFALLVAALAVASFVIVPVVL